jgi:hypothetical protein
MYTTYRYNMCYYRLFIFNGCGHSTVSETPVRYCKDTRTRTASTQEGAGSTTRSRSHLRGRNTTKPRDTIMTPPTSDPQAPAFITPTTRSQASGDLQPCGEGRVHPFHCVRLDRICPECVEEREERLGNLEREIREIRFDPAKWHWKFQGVGRRRMMRGWEGDGV